MCECVTNRSDTKSEGEKEAEEPQDDSNSTSTTALLATIRWLFQHQKPQTAADKRRAPSPHGGRGALPSQGGCPSDLLFLAGGGSLCSLPLIPFAFLSLFCSIRQISAIRIVDWREIEENVDHQKSSDRGLQLPGRSFRIARVWPQLPWTLLLTWYLFHCLLFFFLFFFFSVCFHGSLEKITPVVNMVFM